MPKFRSFPDCFDECKQMTITSLNRLGYLLPDRIVRGSYSWTRFGRPSGSVSITVSLPDRYVEFDYSYADEPINYRVALESVPKHFGGCECYFICPATGKRCRTLYGIGAMFLSRFAYPDAMYRCRTEPKSERGFRRLLTLHGTKKNPKAEWDYFDRKHYRTHYKGRPTKRYRAYLERTDKIKAVLESGVWRSPLFRA